MTKYLPMPMEAIWTCLRKYGIPNEYLPQIVDINSFISFYFFFFNFILKQFSRRLLKTEVVGFFFLQNYCTYTYIPIPSWKRNSDVNIDMSVMVCEYVMGKN
uniref:Uncharacterized protein n=1 Tax=Cacopsylla melanoneura TaxID=428564 RepID=A0A8D9AVD0_9HEMI